jgi:hypothetical protein
MPRLRQKEKPPLTPPKEGDWGGVSNSCDIIFIDFSLSPFGGIRRGPFHAAFQIQHNFKN